MKKFTIIIPTMWKHPSYLMEMLKRYVANDLVTQVVIIDNDTKNKPNIKHNPKIEYFECGSNLYVNPSWNIGVILAYSKRVIIANDDILISNLNEVLSFIIKNLKQNEVFGIDKSCYYGKSNALELVEASKMEYGFGTFMAMFKKSYVRVPKEFKVWYGDNFQFNKNTSYTIKGVKIKTPMQGTTSHLDLSWARKYEKLSYAKYRFK